MHDDIIKWKNFPRNRPFVWGIHHSPVNSPLKGQSHGIFMFSLIWTRINDWINNGEAGDFRRHRAHYDVTVMVPLYSHHCIWLWPNPVRSYVTCRHGDGHIQSFTYTGEAFEVLSTRYHRKNKIHWNICINGPRRVKHWYSSVFIIKLALNSINVYMINIHSRIFVDTW